MKNKYLFICNTVYQTLVALWISHNYFSNKEIDFWISDHMNNGQIITSNINKLNNNYFAKFIKTKEFIYQEESNIENKKYWRMFPNKLLEKYVKTVRPYAKVFIANMDKFAQLTYNAICHIRREKVQLYLYEDGISTYSLLMKKFYEHTRPYINRGLKNKVFNWIFRYKNIWGNIKCALVFNPELMAWTPSINKGIKKIDLKDSEFLNIVNKIFDYDKTYNEYSNKYIFMEESYFADGIDVQDIDIVSKIADKVGKDNIIIKIHPRNPINRFAQLGYKTNKNTSVPWEVICMNMSDISEKVLFSISSSSLVMPGLIFGKHIKSYSFIKYLDNNMEARKKIGEELLSMIEKIYYVQKVEIISP